ncbi:MAG: radical SAM protein [Bacteroidota bacterium]|nr:radical SAM protein [Bacteroidota bacterium]
MKQKHYTIPIFIPELACPFQCVFCNQKKISGQLKVPSEHEIIKTIEEHLSTINYINNEVEVGFFGGNFTGIPLKEQEKFLQLTQPFIRQGKIKSIRLSTRPDYITKNILDLLSSYHVETIELGAQSMDEEVLKQSKRGHTAKQTEEAASLIRENGFRLGLQMMIGLPADTPEKSLFTAKKIVELQADDARIYPCLVIRGTKLADWYQEGSYQSPGLEETVEWTKAVYLELEKGGVNIIRTGLHPSESLSNQKDLLAGPYHPSFKELVMTAIWTEILKPLMKKHYRRRVKIHVPACEVHFAIGHASKNKKALLEHYDEVKILGDEGMKRRKFFVDYF